MVTQASWIRRGAGLGPSMDDLGCAHSLLSLVLARGAASPVTLCIAVRLWTSDTAPGELRRHIAKLQPFPVVLAQALPFCMRRQGQPSGMVSETIIGVLSGGDWEVSGEVCIAVRALQQRPATDMSR